MSENSTQSLLDEISKNSESSSINLLKTILSFNKFLEDLPEEEREFFRSFKYDKPGCLSRFVDGVEWKLYIRRDSRSIPTMEFWKDDDKIKTVEHLCCMICMLERFFGFVWTHKKSMQSIAGKTTPNPKSPWAQNG